MKEVEGGRKGREERGRMKELEGGKREGGKGK